MHIEFATWNSPRGCLLLRFIHIIIPRPTKWSNVERLANEKCCQSDDNFAAKFSFFRYGIMSRMNRGCQFPFSTTSSVTSAGRPCCVALAKAREKPQLRFHGLPHICSSLSISLTNFLAGYLSRVTMKHPCRKRCNT